MGHLSLPNKQTNRIVDVYGESGAENISERKIWLVFAYAS